MYADDSISGLDVLHAINGPSYLYFDYFYQDQIAANVRYLALAYGIISWDSIWGEMDNDGYGTHSPQSLYDPGGNYAVMQDDGNFVLYRSSSWLYPVWWTGTDGNYGAWLAMQDNGNLVVYSSGGSPLWSIY